ncbi:MAG: hypothetical protein L0H47_02180 [Micrococcaceae bacterium]|nr:hypothetical protein [Micrococcaceae bacterium]
MADVRSVRRLLSRSSLLLVAVLALTLLGASGAGMAEPTEAQWADAESSSGRFTALRVESPTPNGGCTYVPHALKPDKILLYWHLPAGQTLEDIRFEAKSNRGISIVDKLNNFSFLDDSHPDAGPNNYRTEVPVGLLSALLGLGAKITLTLTSTAGAWTSAPMSAVATLPTLTIGGKCSNVPA